ncbi:hypothetical protein QS257_11190 [Terrilactibacillus sp. S3-3]|nr:hypothetical protein QS257_11190 [Terrilactibacillus sp. S3-3]
MLLTASLFAAVVPILSAGHAAKSSIKVQRSQAAVLWAETFGRENSYFQAAVKEAKSKVSGGRLLGLLLSQADHSSPFLQSEETPIPFKKYSAIFLQENDPIFSFDTPEQAADRAGQSKQASKRSFSQREEISALFAGAIGKSAPGRVYACNDGFNGTGKSRKRGGSDAVFRVGRTCA